MTPVSGIWAFALAAFVFGRLAEWRVHRRNYAVLSAMGANELAPWLMRGYYALTLAVVPVALFEQLVTAVSPSPGTILVGSAMASLGLLLRLWAIRSLGALWTMRCMALPGMRPLNAGPYRMLDNPEYLSRLIEAAGLCLLLRAELTLTVLVTLTAACGVYLSGLERRQLAEVGERRGYRGLDEAKGVK